MWPTLEVWTCVFMTVTCFHDHLLHSYSLFPHQYIALPLHCDNENYVQFSVIIIIIKSNDTGWVLFTRKVWRTLSVKKSCYDKNWIFIILNLHHDAPFNLSPAALAMPHNAARRCSIFICDLKLKKSLCPSSVMKIVNFSLILHSLFELF